MSRRPLRLRALRAVSPGVRALLRSPAAPLLGRRLVVLEYTGRLSGRRYAIPVVAIEDGARALVIAARPASKRWWRSFEQPAPAVLGRRGVRREVTGRVLTGPERRDALRAYLRAVPSAASIAGGAVDAADDELDRADAAIVAFTPLGPA